MPELPEVETVRRRLGPVITGRRIVDVELRRPDLRLPFPPRFRARLRGQTVLSLDRRAKYLLALLSSGETLLVHLGMSGDFSVDGVSLDDLSTAAPGPHDHVRFLMADGAAVTFTDPRRFGLMDLLTPRRLAEHPVLSRLGPEPLSPDFDGEALARACAGRYSALKVTLLDQRVVAGLGNIYASEALHVARLSPKRRASTIATPGGSPRPGAHALAAAITKVLAAAVDRRMRDAGGPAGFRVYDREGKRCLRTGCTGTIRRIVQAGRSTFYCPVCQR